MLFPFKTPEVFKKIFPTMIWEVKETDSIFLTFDDGPHPEITEWVIELLDQYSIKATFFCVGNNAKLYPKVMENLKSKGHTIGNHTMNHVNGWKSDLQGYLKEVEECKNVIDSKLFRPPYGRIRRKQRLIIEKEYKIVQWTLLSGDFNPSLSKERALKALKKHTSSGSIVVFHDSLKAEDNLKYLLPKYLDYCVKNGYKFGTL
jgi:peptidoglycan/xylan/chitin deacetylase (PgdA/CDA1 family)